MKGLSKIFLFLLILSAFSFAVFFSPRPANAALLLEENQTILRGDPAAGAAGFDDKAFNLNQMAGTVDSLNYFLNCQSQAHPEIVSKCTQNKKSAMGILGGMIASLYQPPASSIQYLAYLKENLGLATPVYAQARGSGFGGLSYLLPVWRTFRDAAYLVFILLFLITGLLIMFRVKISPQAVVSLQNALPKLLITLVLITLSYAIVGLLIDIMYVLIYLVIGLITQATPSSSGWASLKNFQGQDVFSYWGSITNLGFESINKPSEAVATLIGNIVKIPFLDQALSSTGRGLMTLVLTIAIAFALFRLFFALLRSYIWVLVLLIFGPFILLAGAMPGGGAGISGWIRGLLANLIIFPTAVAMFSLAAVFITLAQAPATGVGWTAPLIGGGSVQAVQALIGLGMILLTPQVTQMMNDALKPPPFPYGVAIGQSLGAGPGLATTAGRRIASGRMPTPGTFSWGRTIFGG